MHVDAQAIQAFIQFFYNLGPTQAARNEMLVCSWVKWVGYGGTMWD